MTKEEIVAEYMNNPVQWMLQHECKNHNDVLYKMMDMWAEIQLKNFEGGLKEDAPQYDFCLLCHAKTKPGKLYCEICRKR